MTTSTNWRNDAACLGVDPDLFFPIGTAGPALDQIDEAKRICRACPVRERCLAWALERGAATGIWGGTTDDERRALRRAAARDRARETATAD
jgi:WhiB family transcriptional regulator, redox-sensing transcriptional regulator